MDRKIGTGVIIDDSLYTQLLLEQILEDSGLSVLGIANSGKEGFQVVAETRPQVVFLDLSIPDMKPEEIIRGLLSINRNVRIIILASISQQVEIFNLIKLGASDYLPKPIVQSQVEYILKKVELMARYPRMTKLQVEGFLLSIFFGELVKTASVEHHKDVKLSVVRPLKRLMKQYPSRYQISPEKIKILVIDDGESSDNSKKIKRQLDNLYRSVMRNLEKIFEPDVLKSFILEAYQSFYFVGYELIEEINFKLLPWRGFIPFPVSVGSRPHRNIINYVKLTDIVWNVTAPFSSDYSRLKTYSFTVEHDPRTAPKFPTKRKSDINIYGIYSIFDEIYGPRTAIIYPPTISKIEMEKLKGIPRLLDLTGTRENDPFIHASETFGSINLIFSTSREDARGSSFDQMLSICAIPLDVYVLGRLSQLKGLLRAIAAQLSDVVANMSPEEVKDIGKFKSEPSEIIADLVDEVRNFI